MTHILKTWPEFFYAVKNGSKTFEVRSTKDRKFKVGEKLILKWYDPDKKICNGETIHKQISYILEDPQFGLQEGFAVLGLKEVEGSSDEDGSKYHSESN